MNFRQQIIFLFACLSFTANSQGWRSRIWLPGSVENAATAVFETAPGSYFGAGFVTDTLSGYGRNYLVVMGLDQEGQILWHKKYGRPQFEYLSNNFIQRTFYKKGNHFYLACCVRDSLNQQIGALLKFDQNGDTLWQKIYRSATMDVIPQMVTGSVDGGLLITGFFQDWNNNTQPALLIKTDANGNELWRKVLNKTNPNVSDGKAIIQDTLSKKIMIAGYRYNTPAWNSENILILDSLGNNPVLRNAGSYGATITDMIQLKSKEIVFVGRQYFPQTLGGTSLTKGYAVCFKLNSIQQTKWKIVDVDRLALYNSFTCVRQSYNEDIFIGGFLDSLHGIIGGSNEILQNFKCRILSVDTNGNIKSKRYYSYKYNDSASANELGISNLEMCADGSQIVTIRVSNQQPNPFFYVKYDAYGCDSTLAYCEGYKVGFSESSQKNQEIVLFPNPAADFIELNAIGFSKTILSYKIVGALGQIFLSGVLEEDQNTKIPTNRLDEGIYFLTLIDSKGLNVSKKFIISR